MNSFFEQPAELLLSQLLFMEHNDFKNLKLVNRQFYTFIRAHEEFLYKKKLEQEYGKWIHNHKLLFKCSEYDIVINDLSFSKQFDTICYYIQMGDINTVKFLINNNIVSVNIKDNDSKPLLLYLFDEFFHENYSIVADCIELFLEKDIDKNILQMAYYYACQKCDKGTIKKIVEKGVNTEKRERYGWSGQMYAILYNDDVQVIDYLSSFCKLTLSDVCEIITYKREKILVKPSNIYNDDDTIRVYCKKFNLNHNFEYVYFISDCQDELLEFMHVMTHIFKHTSWHNNSLAKSLKTHIFMKICNTIHHYYNNLSMTEKNAIFDTYLKDALLETKVEDYVNDSIYKDIFDMWSCSFY